MNTNQNFKFPDEADADAEVDVDLETGTASAVESKVEIEVVDDTPEEDRGRKPAVPPEEVTDDELATYDEKVQKRIKRFTRGFHDERRAKEQAQREREAAEQIARQAIEENRKLQEQLHNGSKVYIDQAKQLAETELQTARRKFQEAYENGEADKLSQAQEEVTRAAIKAERAGELKPLQVTENKVQTPQAPQVDSRTVEWQRNNEWFGKNRAMTAYALGLHEELVEEKGLRPSTEAYFKAIDDTMREKFPEVLGSQDPDDGPAPTRATKPAAVVAPAARSTPPNRIRLKASEVAVAKRLGVPLELYAKKVAELRKDSQNG
ncbi:hypothetical protein [Pseudomonas sp.]|uniref:hypothetical protein n=1 Tax=Pseudomonas sp. TaxID=306 RepID=UPI002590832D|nr:hypothetical protein [Pseudomonas sp.]